MPNFLFMIFLLFGCRRENSIVGTRLWTGGISENDFFTFSSSNTQRMDTLIIIYRDSSASWNISPKIVIFSPFLVAFFVLCMVIKAQILILLVLQKSPFNKLWKLSWNLKIYFWLGIDRMLAIKKSHFLCNFHKMAYRQKRITYVFSLWFLITLFLGSGGSLSRTRNYRRHI